MFRRDGMYKFYRIQHSCVPEKWSYSSLDYFGIPPGFSASDDCWQQTGVFGTFDINIAQNGLKWIAKKNPECKFRIVEVMFMQSTKPVSAD